MPRITISEEDLTLTNNLDVTANVVYVPGISNQGPINVPTLCTSLSDFINIFGDQPYVFKSAQTDVNSKTVAQIGDFEKSFIYACELLNAGLHIMFERILDQNSDSITAPSEEVNEWEAVSPVPTASSFVPNKYYKGVDNEGTITYVLAEKFEETATYYQKDITDDTGLVLAVYDKFNPSAQGSLSVFNKLQDKWTYNIKFITTGSYSVLDVVSGSRKPIVEMLSMIAAVRGDSIALLDHAESVTDITTVYSDINTMVSTENMIKNYYTLSPANGTTQTLDTISVTVGKNRKTEITLKYSAVFAPWGVFRNYTPNIVALEDQVKLPGSFAYLLSLANSITTYDSPDYYAIAGVTRGLVPHIQDLSTVVTGAEAESVQVRTKDKVSINPLVNVQGYGFCIWGNRTLFPNVSSVKNTDGDLAASSFLNIRVLASDVKKIIYAACQKYTFETNSTELWLKFKSDVEPTLQKMVSNGSLQDFELTKLTTTEKATLSVYVKLVTIYAVEDFDITIGLTDSTVEETE